MEAGIPFAQPLLLLAGAVLAAPLFKRFGLGTILGYLAAGFVIGPVAQLVADGDQILNVAQLGIVFLLFIIGLELSPSRLWALRREMFGLGLAQVAACAIAFTALAVLLLGQSIAVALILGLGLAQSSTAFAMQLLEEEGAVNRRYGRTTLS
ncbi:MAG TPA: cation:proton antiporter, partial [Rhizobiaceae bacterium]|nr:cation:proton antiporter [Rhizobiaceae bacterium]